MNDTYSDHRREYTTPILLALHLVEREVLVERRSDPQPPLSASEARDSDSWPDPSTSQSLISEVVPMNASVVEEQFQHNASAQRILHGGQQ